MAADATFEEFFSNSGGGGVDIGDSTLQQQAGTYYQKNAQFYLRSGLFVDKAAFPAAAADERTKVTGIAGVLPVSIKVYESAHNGAGTILVCYNSTSVLRSTDYGQTWSAVALGVSAVATAVVWTGSRFIVASNDTTTIFLRWSTDGSSWGGSAAVTSSSLVSSSVTGAWNATSGTAMFVAKGNATGALTTADGSAATQRTLPSAIQTAFVVVKNGDFVIGATSGGDIFKTASGAGGSFTTYSPGAGVYGQPCDAVVIGSTIAFFPSSFGGGYTYVTTSDFVTFTPRSLPSSFSFPPRSNENGTRPLTGDGVKAYYGSNSSVLWTTDLINWFTRWTSVVQADGTHHIVAGRALLPTAGTAPRTTASRTADWTVADYVGNPVSVAFNNLAAFVRLR